MEVFPEIQEQAHEFEINDSNMFSVQDGVEPSVDHFEESVATARAFPTVPLWYIPRESDPAIVITRCKDLTLTMQEANNVTAKDADRGTESAQERASVEVVAEVQHKDEVVGVAGAEVCVVCSFLIRCGLLLDGKVFE